MGNWLKRGALVSALAFVLASSLLVTTTTRAEAFQPPIDLGVATKDGKTAVQIGKGATLAGRTSNPVGWAITAGQIAWWAYSDRDSISDFIRDPDDRRKTLCQYIGTIQCEINRGTNSGTKWTGAGIQLEMTGTTSTHATFHAYLLDLRHSCANQCYYGQTSYNLSVNTGTLTDGSTGPGKVLCNTPGGLVQSPFTGLQVFLGQVNWGGPAEDTRTVRMCPEGSKFAGFEFAQQPNQSWPAIKWAESPKFAELLDKTFDFTQAKVTARCKNAETGEETTITARSSLKDKPTVVFPSCKQHLGEDWYGKGFTVAPEKPEIDNKPVPDEIAVPDYPPLDWDELIPEEFSQDCQKTKEGCKLGVWIDNNPCTIGDPKCSEWPEIQRDDQSRVKCKWGRVAVPMSLCLQSLRDLYKQGGKTQTTPGQTTKPETNTGLETTTGKPMQIPRLTPEEAQESEQCFPSGWGVLNPVEWVFKPVKCALTWGFKPKTAFKTRLQRMADKLKGKPPIKWMVSLATVPTPSYGGGCPSWTVKVKNVQREVLCGTPFGNAMRGFRGSLVIMCVGAAFWPLIRGVMYASFPVIKPQPSK